MTLQEALIILKTFHAWRIDDDEVYMQKPSEVTKAINTLLKYHIGDVNKMGETVTDCNVSEIPTSHTKTEQMTSIEWLANGFVNIYPKLELNDKFFNLLKESKEMHKQEIIDACNKSFELRDKPYSTAHKYYQETFKKNK